MAIDMQCYLHYEKKKSNNSRYSTFNQSFMYSLLKKKNENFHTEVGKDIYLPSINATIWEFYNNACS